MSVERLIDTLTKWAQENICNHIQLKQPPLYENEPVDEGYEYTLVHPTAFPMYIPTPERLPPNIKSPYPSICVGFSQGEDQATKSNGFLDVQFTFSAWNPGTHGGDLLTPNGNGGMIADNAKAYFQVNAEGWRDVWRFVDLARRAIESQTVIADSYTIDKSSPIKFGPLAQQEAIPDMYPYWFAWVTFRVNYPLLRNIPSIQNML